LPSPLPLLRRSGNPPASCLFLTCPVASPQPSLSTSTTQNSTGTTLVDDPSSHGGAHITALAWAGLPGAAAGDATPQLLTGGLDKAVRLWGASSSSVAPAKDEPPRLVPRSTWHAPKKVSAVAAVALGQSGEVGEGGTTAPNVSHHVFFSDRYGDVLSAPMAAQDDETSTTTFALGHLSSVVARVLAVPPSSSSSSGPCRHHHPALLATADADGKVRLSKLPASAEALEAHGCPEVQAYGLGHQSAVVDLAVLMVPEVWVKLGEEGAAETGPTPTTTPVIVSGGADGTVRLWCPATGTELCRVALSKEEEQEEEEEDQDEEEEAEQEGGAEQQQPPAEPTEDAAARQAMERMQRLEAALAPEDGDYLRDVPCRSIAAVAATSSSSSSRAPLVAAAVEGEHNVRVFAVEKGEGRWRLNLQPLRQAPIPGVRFPTSLQFAPKPSREAAERGCLLWAAGGLPSPALVTAAAPPTAAEADAMAATTPPAADASADVGAVDAQTGEEAAGVAAAALAALRGGGGNDDGDDAPPYLVPLLWQRRAAERQRQGRAHGARLKRGRTDFAETARLARLQQQQQQG
jgi:hypothetical protein